MSDVEARKIPPGVFEAFAPRLKRWLKTAQITPWRPIDKFAQEEIILPTGPYEGYGFKVDRQPYARLFFDEINKGCWQEIAATGPSQSGKTLVCFVIPIMWHVFELRESVIVFAPDEDICKEKWQRDILPVIKKTRYRKYLPERGPGARGGFGELIQFSNGGSIKWMTAGGDDKSRAHYTSRVVVMTEVDGMAHSSSTSDEADKVAQVEARANSYGDRRIVYKECTVSTPNGHIWQAITRGTNSQILTPCPHCKQYVTMTRECLVGWQECESDVVAKRSAYLKCPKCERKWTERQRVAAERKSVLLHDGQKLVDNKIKGDPKETYTLGFRWTAANNLLVPIGQVAVEEWKGSRSVNPENAERKMSQFFWAVPYDNPDVEITQIDPRLIRERQDKWPRGYVPEESKWITVGVDVQKRLLYWTVIATMPAGHRHIVDYGRLEVASDDHGVAVALPSALRELRDVCNTGWTDTAGEIRPADEIWIDAGAWTDHIFAFIREGNTDSGRFRPCFGRGFGQQKRQWYNRPKKTGGVVKLVGDEYHFTYQPAHQVFHVEFNSDVFKSRLHSGLMISDVGGPGAITLFKAPAKEHTSFCAHMAAEQQSVEFLEEKGNVTVWRAVSRNNHWLDSTCLALAASHFCMEKREESVSNGQKKQQNERSDNERGYGGVRAQRIY